MCPHLLLLDEPSKASSMAFIVHSPRGTCHLLFNSHALQACKGCTETRFQNKVYNLFLFKDGLNLLLSDGHESVTFVLSLMASCLDKQSMPFSNEVMATYKGRCHLDKHQVVPSSGSLAPTDEEGCHEQQLGCSLLSYS